MNERYRPDGVTAVTAYLSVTGGADAIAFYQRAFGAEEVFRAARPDGSIEHATLRIDDATIYLSDETAGAPSPRSLGGTPVTFHLYVPDCDATYERAIAAGATAVSEMRDQEWGDRYGQVEDPFGHRWGIATMIREPE